MAIQDVQETVVNLGEMSSSATGALRINLIETVPYISRLFSNVYADSVNYVGATTYLLENLVFDGTLNSNVSANESITPELIDFNSSLLATATGLTYDQPEFIDIAGSLSSTVSSELLQNGYAAMYGFGAMNVIEGLGVGAICIDLFIDMQIQEIISSGCTTGDSDMIQRYRGDDYPIQATLGRNGNFDISGMSFIMSSQIGSGTIYAATGTIIDATIGIAS